MMDNEVIIFIPYGSRLGFHVGGPASTMANIDYKFPQCVCYEVQMDVNKESHFFETASIFEENWIERNTVNALRNHATGVGMGVLVQMDVNCWQQNQRDEVRIMGDKAGSLTAQPGVRNQNYLIYEVQMDEQVIGCDLYNQVLTGVACALTAIMEVAGHSGTKVLIVKDEPVTFPGASVTSPVNKSVPTGGCATH